MKSKYDRLLGELRETDSDTNTGGDSIDYTVNGAQPDADGNFAVTAESIGAATAEHQHVVADVANLQSTLGAKADADSLNAHIGNVANPHSVTKSQVGLGKADNTADADKPVSNVQQAALNTKADVTALNAHLADTATHVTAAERTASAAFQQTAQAHLSNIANPHSVTKSQVGLGNVDNTADADKPVSAAQQTAIDAKADADVVNAHLSAVNNPHSVTKSQVGLGSVDNTADADKPVSAAQQTAISAKADVTALNAHLSDAVAHVTAEERAASEIFLQTAQAHLSNTANPHSVTKSQVGLGNVDNTTDADKPVSTAQQTAISAKADATELNTHIADAVVHITATERTDVATLMSQGQAHLANVSNPHSVTKAQVGLGSVDNTSDIDKPLSTAQQNALGAKLNSAILAPTKNIYVDGNRADAYIEDGSIARPYKTIAAATAAHQVAAAYLIAKGTYAETAEINLHAGSIIYGNYATISGAAINIGQGCFINNLMFYNAVNVAANSDSPMFHYCRFIEATLNLAGNADFEGCYITEASTFAVTMTAASALRAFNCTFRNTISSAGQLSFCNCLFNAASTGYVITSTGGMLAMASCVVYNTGTGGGIFCNNGANGVTAYNSLLSVATNKDIACGTAVAIIGGDVHYTSISGTAIVFPARIQAALATKAAATFSGIQVIINGSAVTYCSSLDSLQAYLNTLNPDTTDGIVLNFAPGDYSTTASLTFPGIRMVLNGNNSELIIAGELSFSRNVIIRNFSGITATTLTFHNANIDNAELTGTVVCLGSVSTSFVNVTGNVAVNTADRELAFTRGSIAGSVSSVGSLVMIDAVVYTASTGPVVSSTGGTVRAMNSYIINYNSGGGISCSNGATASNPNAFSNVIVMNGTIAAGSAVTLLGPLHTATAPSGTALINLRCGTISAAELGCLAGVTSSIQTQLDAKADAAELPVNLSELSAPSGLQCRVNGQVTRSFATFGALIAYLETLTLTTVSSVVIDCAPRTYAETAAVAFPSVPVIINANYSVFNFSGGINFGTAAVRIDNAIINGAVTIAKGYLENCYIIGNVTIASGPAVQLLHGNIEGNVTVASGGWYIGTTQDITGIVTSAGRVFMGAGCSIISNSSSPSLTSSAGTLQLSDCSISNSGSGGCVSCNNGATASAPNAISNVMMSGGTINAGSAVTLVGPVYVTTTMSGTAIARLNVG